SSLIGWIFLPSTPPDALISSTASRKASRTVTSLIAMVPDSELSRPTLTVSPDVSATAPPPDGVPPVLLPQAVSAAPAARVAANPTIRRRVRRALSMNHPSATEARYSDWPRGGHTGSG